MKNKGFTLIELLVLIAIIGILSTVILTSIQQARCKDDPKRKNCDIEEKIEYESKEESSIADKFDRSKNINKEISIGIEEYERNIEEPTMDTACGNIPNYEARSMCEDEYRRSKNLEECYNRYAN